MPAFGDFEGSVDEDVINEDPELLSNQVTALRTLGVPPPASPQQQQERRIWLRVVSVQTILSSDSKLLQIPVYFSVQLEK